MGSTNGQLVTFPQQNKYLWDIKGCFSRT